MNSTREFINSQDFQSDKQEEIDIGKYSYSSNNVIGIGSSSIVYKGRDKTQQQMVAIKVIDLKRITTTIQKVLIENQKKVIRKLIQLRINGVIHHQQIVETPKHVCIVMQNCLGGDFEKIIKLGKINQEKVKKYLLKLLLTYITLAENKIVHRDLKPANILLNQFGDIKISDFGFAVLQELESYQYKYCVGSPVYCSPEALQKFQNGIKSDIWALGIIGFKMLTTKTPWKGKNNKQLLNNMKNIPITSLIQYIKDKVLKQFIIGCCKVNTAERFGLKQLKQFTEILRYNIQGQENMKQNSIDNKQKTKQETAKKFKIFSKQPQNKKKFAQININENQHKLIKFCI